jgi:RES domain
VASPHFSSWNSYWAFSHAVRFRSRFIHDRQVATFLRAISATAKQRVTALSSGKALWRAQVGHALDPRKQDGVEYDEPVPFNAERMKPLRSSAHEGRVNPRGIPCLYAASDKETSVSEVRPWLGALVSVAQLTPKKQLKLVNCLDSRETRFDLYLEEPAPEIREQVVWRALGRAFSEPVDPDPAVAEYAPTQILAEHFKKLGYDGVVYRSTLGKGMNFAIFDIDALDVVDVRLYPVTAVQYEIGEVRNSYVVRRRKLDA